nr:signal peptidase II [Candidatus Baumannia cicadellinicola]
MIYSKIISTGLSWLWLTLVVLLIDISSKQWIINNFFLGESVSITPCINLLYTYNSGAAFSFLANQNSWNMFLLSFIAMIVSIVLLVMMYNSDYYNRISNIAYAMIIGGALGNLFDRIKYGVVIDFIDVYFDTWHWPIFNIADASICTGVIIIVLKNSSVAATTNHKLR